MDDTLLIELSEALAAAVSDPNCDIDELSRLGGLVLNAVAQSRGLPPDLARRSGRSLWEAAQEGTADTRAAVRRHAEMVLRVAAGVGV